LRWRVVYQAPSAPDAAVALPQQSRQHSSGAV
jgi:hypothetical protein